MGSKRRGFQDLTGFPSACGIVFSLSNARFCLWYCSSGDQYSRGGSSTRQGFLKAGGLAAAGVIAAMGAVSGTIVEGRGLAVETAEAAVGVEDPAVLLQKEASPDLEGTSG